MEHITAEQTEERARKAADMLVKKLEQLNERSAGPSLMRAPSEERDSFTWIFAYLLSTKYVIVPRKAHVSVSAS